MFFYLIRLSRNVISSYTDQFAKGRIPQYAKFLIIIFFQVFNHWDILENFFFEQGQTAHQLSILVRISVFYCSYFTCRLYDGRFKSCRFENLAIYILHIKSSMTQISHYCNFLFLRYAHFRYAKCLFTNIQKQQNTLKSSLLVKKITNFPGK